MTTPSIAIPRLVVIDDTDPEIQYSPASAFSLDSQGTLDGQGWGGPVWNKTITGTTTNASFSYVFNGTFVRTIIAAQGSSYHWNCTVDDHLISSFSVNTTQITNYIGCDSGGTLEGLKGPHTLNMDLHFSPSNDTSTQSIWLDSIEYQPLPEDSLDSVTMRIHNSDPSVMYSNSSGGWSWQGFESNSTGRTGTSMNFEFNGSSVSLYSVIFGWPTLYNASTAFYTIDGNSSSDFDLPGSKQAPSLNSYANILNYPLFTVTNLSESSSHNIQVATAFNGTTFPQWLTIDYFMIRTNPAVSSPPAQSANSSTPDNGQVSNSVGPIVGGVLGGLIALAALVSLIFLYIRRRRRQNSYSGMMLDSAGGGAGYYRLQGSSGAGGGDTLEIMPFTATSNTSSGHYTPTKYASEASSSSTPGASATAYIGYTGQTSGAIASSSSGVGSSSGHSDRLLGWDSNRFVIPSSKDQRALQEAEDRRRRSEARQHSDSGVRLSQTNGAAGDIEDVPPTYTES
ncbi:hypothetical protein D9757_000460 [Collybiopsis confluens]|uniref:Uncharacterized protein n=1 Tax=Collybiopsis confluens TaxID=2823264 RepID=A0A8H5I1V9_9AGAR|nr:hypothetical protein D9757_000460 [Collybiopsis confluens]